MGGIIKGDFDRKCSVLVLSALNLVKCLLLVFLLNRNFANASLLRSSSQRIEVILSSVAISGNYFAIRIFQRE